MNYEYDIENPQKNDVAIRNTKNTTTNTTAPPDLKILLSKINGLSKFRETY